MIKKLHNDISGSVLPLALFLMLFCVGFMGLILSSANAYVTKSMAEDMLEVSVRGGAYYGTLKGESTKDPRTGVWTREIDYGKAVKETKKILNHNNMFLEMETGTKVVPESVVINRERKLKAPDTGEIINMSPDQQAKWGYFLAEADIDHKTLMQFYFPSKIKMKTKTEFKTRTSK